jgi:diguanylate cyclase (GGDEF)-like protein
MGPALKVKHSVVKISEVGTIGMTLFIASNRRASGRIFRSPLGSESLLQVQNLVFASGMPFSVSTMTKSPITMNLLRFITVENLCLAAEVTAALLLIAFAIPDRKKPAAAPSAKNDSESQRHLETARRAHCQATMYRGIATLAKRCTEDPAAGRFELYAPLALLGWEDRLTKLGNRSFLDAFLEEWLALPESTRQGSLLTMIVVDKYSDLLREQGAMGVEQSLRSLGERIAQHYESTAIIGRYQPDRFLVLQFERSLTEAHEDFESLNNSASHTSEESQKSPLSVSCVASIVELGEEGQSLSDSLDKLDEGVAQAIETGSNCVSEFEGAWTNKRPMTDHARSIPRESAKQGAAEESAKPAERRRLTPEATTTDGKTTEESPSATPTVSSNGSGSKTTEPTDAPDSVASVQSSAPASSTPEPTDVSAVASSEDIAALFEQINKKKQESASVEPPKATPAAPTKPASPIGGDDVVGADDIAALFAANAPAKKPEPKAAPAEPPKPAVPIGDDDVVGADDIAALFAANAPAKKPEPKAAPPEPPKPAAPIGDDDVVGADDIAALFAANAPAKKPEPKAAPAAPPKPAAKSDSKLNELLNNLHNDVTNDDLDSLFANVQ